MRIKKKIIQKGKVQIAILVQCANKNFLKSEIKQPSLKLLNICGMGFH
jgi:hypothetical protein